jgi:hypothetical protein
MSVFLILILPLALLSIPIWLQARVGKRVLNQKKRLKFILVSIGSLLLEVVMAIMGLFLSFEGQQMKGIKSLSPGILSAGFLALVILVIVIIAQLLSKGSIIKD